MNRNNRSRRAVATVEAAFVFPVVVFFILAIIVGAAGIFRYAEVCYVSREGARYASVHGTDYAKESGNPAATPADVFANAIRPKLMLLSADRLTYDVTWDKSNSPYSTLADFEKPVNNTVTVTVTYTWLPEVPLIGSVTFRSSSTLPMSY
jgi:Flp pilus assembly protein TadG